MINEIPQIKSRTISTVSLWAALGALLYVFDVNAAVWLIMIAAVLSLRELYALWRKCGVQPSDFGGVMLTVPTILAGHYATWFGTDSIIIMLGIGVVVFALELVFKPTAEFFFKSLLPTLAGVALISFPLSFFVLTMESFTAAPQKFTGLMLALWIVAVTKFADVGALLVGSKWGKKKLAPHISPGKTVEGVLGGLATAALISALAAWLGKDIFPDAFTPQTAAIMALPVAAAGVLSDLLESVFKRMAGVKDSGNLVPGIGGVYDLVDSLVLAAPVAYALFQIVF